MNLYPESTVNTYRSSDQQNPDVAVLADGSYVTTWQSNQQDGSGWGIYFQRYSAAGVPLGAEFRVNTAIGGDQVTPKVAGLSSGGFVITWTDQSGQDGSSYGVYGQRYDAAGTPQGANFGVNTTTTSTQQVNGVASYTGGFVAMWSSNGNPGANGYDLYMQRYDNAGGKLGGEVLVGKAVGSASSQAGDQFAPDIAAAPSGDFMVVWQDQGSNDGSSYGVYARLYTASSATFSETFLVNTFTTGAQYEPSVARLAGGGYVVAWRSDGQDGSSAGVYAQRFDAAGAKAGGEFIVNQTTNGGQYQPNVLALSTGGFVIGFYNDNVDVSGTGTSTDVYVREYTAAGVAVTGQVKLISATNSYESQPVMVDLGNGNYVVTYTDYNTADNTSDIAQQLFGPDLAGLPRQADPVVGGFNGSVTFSENLVNATPQPIKVVVSLTDVDSTNFDGGRLDLYFVQNAQSTDFLGVRNVGSGPDQIGVSGNVVSYEGLAIGTLSSGGGGGNLVVTLNANATLDAVQELIQNLTYSTTSQSPAASRTVGLRVADGDGGASASSTVTINVTPDVDGASLVWGESFVNSYTPNDQQRPDVATLTDGSYVVVWQSYDQDSSALVSNTWGIYAQRYTHSGVPVGPEIRVNTVGAGTQDGPHVAALPNGNFVVLFDDNAGVDGSGQGVIGQIYTAAGVAQGGNFVANPTTSGTQQYSDVAAYAGGGSVAPGFAVAYSTTSGPGGDGSWDIYLQRYDLTGARLGSETRVSALPGAPNAPGPGTQITAALAAYANGDLVIVWRDDSGNDGGATYGVFGRKYFAATNTFGTPFQVNTNFVGNQYEPAVATLADGGFVVVWRDDNYDGSSAAVLGQRYDAAGNPAGGPFLVNESTSGGQYQPAVTGLSSGGFVVSFYNDNYDITGTGTTGDTYIREYDANGNAVDGQRKLGSNTNSYESQPALADLGGGNFVVVYTDDNNTGSGSNDIAQQLFGSAAALPRQANPVVGDFTGSVTFGENLVNAAGQVIDPSVSITDIDSSNFAGGSVDLYYLRGSEATDQLGVRNQGSAADQIGVSGNTVSYGGVTIGTLSGGSNGAALHIDLLAAATPQAVQALVQNLTYGSSSQSPATTRTVGLRLSDGDGGASTASMFTINVTPELDGKPLVYGEERVNTYTAADQTGSQAGVLADGSYVVVWNSSGQDGDSWGVYGQRYNGKGVAQGPEFRVNTITGGEQSYPHVVGLTGAGGGGYVVTWQDNSGSDGSGWGIYGQRYDANGNTVGGQFLVNTSTDNSQYHDVLASYSGGYAVAWATNHSGTNNFDIYLQRYDNAGAKVGGQTLVSTNPASGTPGTAQDGVQQIPDMAAFANGDLVVVWRDDAGNDGGSTYGVFGRVYFAGSNTFSATFQVNTNFVGNQYEPSVATLSDGTFVVVWRDDNADGSSAAVIGQRFSGTGSKLGGEFQINESVVGGQYQPAVAGLSTGGFVVTYYNDNYDLTGAGTTQDVYIREYDNAGNALDGQRKLASVSNSEESGPTVADLGGGNFVVTYTDYNSIAGGSSTYDIQQQIFGSAAALARQSNPQVGNFTGTLTFGENLVNATPQVIAPAVSLTDTDSADFAGGAVSLFYVQGGAAADQLAVRNVGNGAGQIGVSGNTVSYGGTAIGTISGGTNGSNLNIALNASATVKAVQTLIQNLTYANTSNSPEFVRTVGLRVSDGDGGSSAASTVTINLTPENDGAPLAYGESRVNTYTPSTQGDSDVATLADGSYVVVWSSDAQDGNQDGVYGQRYSANGLALGNEFRVSTGSSTAQQQYPHVAALSSGGYVVVWQDSSALDGSSWGVIAQRYDASGTPVGNNFVVNTTTVNDQYHGVVAGYSDGFAVVWSATQQAGGSSNDIYIKRYDNSGAVVTAETLVSTTPGQATAQVGNQYVPRVAADAAGNLAIVWRDDNGNDGGPTYGVFGRVYNAASGTFGSTFIVNTNVAGNQYEPAVAMLAGGGFVVVWRDDNFDGSSTAVVGQRFDAAGTKVGSPFLVNETTTGGQYQPAVTGLPSGGFVVSFYNDNYDKTGAGTTSDVYLREYDAAGNAIDGQRKLISASNSEESDPAIASLGGDRFVVTYTDFDSGGTNTYDVKQQIFGTGAALARPSANPLLGDLKGTLSLSNTVGSALNPSTPQLIDNDLSVSDSDSPNFDTGTLSVSFLSGATVSETLVLRNVGTGAGQVGVSGSNVTYGGVVVGTLQTGTSTAPLVVTFNASATVDAVRAVAENVQYANSAVPGGTTTRYVAVRLTDGDGGVGDAQQVQITIQPGAALPTLLLDDVASSVTFTETQAKAGVLVDDAVQLVYAGSTGFANGHLTVAYTNSTARVDDQLSIRNQGSGAGQVAVIGTDVQYQGVSIGTISATSTGVNGADLDITFKAAATDQAIERVIENLVYRNPSNGPLASRSFTINVTDGAGTSGTARSVTVNVTPESDPAAATRLYGEVQVNTYEGGDQSEPGLARLLGSNNGGHVVVWSSAAGQDGGGYGIFGQRYDAKGAPVGAEFRVNTQTLGDQSQPAVAGLASGGYVVTWTDSSGNSLDGSGYSVFAQRYAADGSKAGSSFRVNTSSLGNQYESTVLGLSDGSFVIAYRSDYTASTQSLDVLAQRYDASGVAQGAEFTLNTSGGATQFQPKLAALAGGGFVAVFSDTSGDASGYGVEAQIFTNAGVKVGGLIAVNTTVAGTQQGGDVAALAGGGFVVVWNYNSSTYMQVFSAAGAKVGGEVLVSTADSPATQSATARVAALESGGFVVAWDGSPSAALGGSSQDVMLQQFDASGNRVEGVQVINTTRPSTQYLPDVEGLTGSNFVVAWAGYNQERNSANSYGVFEQIMGTAGSITQSAAPVLVDLVSSVTFAENSVNAAPQIIDAGVSLTDSDTTSFAGGTLSVSIISGYGNIETGQLPQNPAAQDSLSVRNQGTGAGQVGVSLNTISYGGVAVGTLDGSGAAGSDLHITFNAAATADAIEAVIENLQYANSSSSPVASRQISVVVADGAGGASIPRVVTVNVTPDQDGAAPLYANERVNTYGPGVQETPDSARLSDGGYITVWSSTGQDGWDQGVYAQRYDSKGVPLGAEFRVNTTTPYAQYEPVVTALNGGGYVVAWRSENQDGSGSALMAQRFDNAGTAQGNEFRVNTTTVGSQYQGAITSTADGGFVVAWYSDNNTGGSNYYDVLFQRYNAAGVPQGGETRGNPADNAQTAQSQPALAGLTGGGFVMLWTDSSTGDGNGWGIFGQRFNADGSTNGVSFQVNSYTPGNQQQPHLAALPDGGFLAAWTSDGQDGNSWGVFAQRYNNAGVKVGSEFRANTSTPGNQSAPDIAVQSDGSYAIAWYSDSKIIVQQFNASGNFVDGELRIDTLDNNNNAGAPAIISLPANGGYVVTWGDYEYSDGSVQNVYQQLLAPAGGAYNRPANPQLVDVVSSVTFSENLVNTTPQVIDSSVGLSDADSSNFNGGTVEVNYLTGYAVQDQLGIQGLYLQDQLGVRNEGTGAGQIGRVGNTVTYSGTVIGTVVSDGSNGSKLTVNLTSTAATVAAVERLIENITYANTFSDPSPSRTVSIRVTDGSGGASVARSVAINVTPEADGSQPLYANDTVNTYQPDTQEVPKSASLSDGSYVTVWASTGQDGWARGVYGQHFDAKGEPVGSEFQVNTYTPFDQWEPAVAGLKNGGYVVVWRSDNQDGSGAGVYAQRFGTDGTPLGSEFKVNTSTSSNQYQPSVTGTADGGFVVGWYTDTNTGGSDYYDVMYQRYDAGGAAQGVESRLNSAGDGSSVQSQPNLASLTGGGFVAVWTDNTKDGSSNGVYGQRFDANGAKQGAAFAVNTYTTSDQSDPHVVGLGDGGYIVTWSSQGQDSSGYGIFAQRYTAAGAAVGSEFRVNSTGAGSQYSSAVVALSNGGYAVAWISDSKAYVQQFDSTGNRVDGEIRVDTLDNNNNASVPTLVALANGAFVVTWQDYDYGGTTYNIYQQLLGKPADFVRQADPVLVDVASSVTFGENTVNETPQIIDPGVGLYDADSPNFDGGVLDVNYLTGYGSQDQLGLQGLRAQDQLGIRNEGSASHQIGVAGSTVNYGGVPIGTITSNGANGNKLTVLFNAQATPDAVEHLIENLTYANTVSNPIASRTISIRVTDGDGGSTVPANVVINVTPQIDGAVQLGIEKTVNTTRGGDQGVPTVARLSDGGYVVVWQDQGGADGSGYGVYGQRYDSNDNAVGTEFRVNTTTVNSQYEAKVVGLTGGGFVATWRSDAQDGSGAGVYGQMYQADGTKLGAEFLVNTTTSSNQYQNKLIGTSSGGFVVAWYHDSSTVAVSDVYEVYFQRYDAAGAKLGGETRATPPIAGNQFAQQSEPGLAWLNDSDGGFVVTWTDNTRDGDSNGVFAQRYSAAGVAEGPVLAVNSYISNNQHNSSVAGLKDGGFIVVWESEGQDLSSTGIYAQRFDAAGAKVGTEVRVNTDISGQQYQPAVAALENGGWVVSWTDTNTTSGDVYLQQYDATGQQIDGETRVNTYRPYVQNTPSVTSMADGGFVVAYSGYIYSSDQNGDGLPDGGNDTFEVRLQRFSNTAPTVSNVSINGFEDTVLTLRNTLFEGGFVDPDGQPLVAVKITTLPSGTLSLNGVPVIPNQVITLAQLQAGALTYLGVTDQFGLDQFRWTGSDGIAFATTPVFTNINLANVNDGPRLGALSNAPGFEGSAFSRSLVIGDPDPEGHQITVNWGDGTPNLVFATSSKTPSIQHVYADDGSYAVTVTVDDQQGQANSIETGNFTALIANVAPTIGLGGASSATQGDPYTLTLNNPSDPGTDTVDQYTINWGDGSPLEVYTPAQVTAASRTFTHIYLAPATDTIVVGLRDEDGSYASAGTKIVQVQAPAEVITVDAGANVAAFEGTFFGKTITFTDPTDQGAPGRTYTVNWGDGNSDSGSLGANVFSFNIGHVYADNGGPYNVVVNVNDDGTVTQQGTGNFQVTVANVAPVVNISAPGSIPEGSVYTMTISPFDPGTDTITQYVVKWGDGATETYTPATLPANRQLSHPYPDGDANFTVTVDVTDEDGTFVAAGSANLFVANVAPSAGVSGPDSINEGSTYTLHVSEVADPGQDTRTGYSINWGDGTPTDNFTPAQWAAFQNAGGNATHVYADGGNGGTGRTIQVLASDEDGTFVIGSKALAVANVAPTVTLTGAANSDEAATYTLNIAATDPGGANDPLNYSVDWGDGSALQNLTAAQLAALSGNVTHVYTDDPDGAVNTIARTVTVTVDDGDGGVTAQNKIVNVNNVAPTAPVNGAATSNEGASYTLTVGAVADPGPDTRTGYSINWGDGNTSTYTPAQWTAAAGSFNHTYADGPAATTITVSTTDEDGTFVLGTQALNVVNVNPTLNISGAAATNEGATYGLSISASDPGGVNDPLSYVIDWGDGSALQNVTAAQLAAASGVINHVYADDEDGPVNATARNISVTVSDGDGGSATQGQSVTVNNVAPTAPVSGAATSNEGANYTLTVGAVVDPGTDTRSGYSIAWGDGNTSTFTPAQWTAAAGSFNHTYADGPTAATITVSATDEDGTFVLGTQALNVVNVNPTLNISGVAATNEGATYGLSISASDPGGANDPLSYVIDWGDGSALQNVTAAQLSAASGVVNHVFADDEDGPVNSTPRNISVTVSDGDGGSATQGQSVNVNNVAPTITLGGGGTAQAAQPYTLVLGAIVDPGQDTVSSYAINWGDGSAVQTLTAAQVLALSGNVPHTYAANGSFGISVALVDEDGTFPNAGTQTVNVSAQTPTLAIEAGPDGNVNEGSTFTRSITFTDGADDGPAGWTYSIDYGDGTAVVNGNTLAKTINLSHLYADGDANRTVTVTVNDDGAAPESASDSFVVHVANVAPTAAVSGAATSNEGASYTLTVGAVVDPGSDTRTGYSIAWGDGNTSTFSPAQWTAAAGNFNHTYADGPSAATITVSTTDEDGTFVLGTQALNVLNVAPTLNISGAASTNEGASYALSISASDPGGANDPLSYVIDWGDGSALQNVTAAQLAAASGVINHVYADDEDGPVNATARSISVTVNDGDGGSATQGQSVTVNNVAPTAPVNGAATADEGASYTLTVGAVVDPGTDTRSGYSINWGDGNTSTYTPAQWTAAAGSFNHTYGDGPAAATITVSTTDEDGTFVLGTQALNVLNLNPTLSISGAATTNEGASYVLAISASDPGGASDPLSYSINWGDGSAVQNLTAAQLAALSGNVSHVFADDEDGPVNTTPRNISVTVNDGDGGSATQGKSVDVNNVAPTLALGGGGTAQVAQPYTLVLGSIVDPGQDTVSSYAINWGDGSAVQTLTAAQVLAASGNIPHTYAANGSFGISVALVDEDGTFANAGTQTVTVSAQAATVAIDAGADADISEGSTFTRSINFTDGQDNGLPGWTYSIDYGDGTAVVNGSTLVKTIDLSHLYADGDANYTVTVTVSDDGVGVGATRGSRNASPSGESASDSFALVVHNVAPTATLTGAATANEGSAYTLSVGAVLDPGADTRSGYSIAWGDGNTSTFTPAQWAAAAGSFDHTYADGPSAPTIVVTATDEDGTFTLGSKALTVQNVAPTLTLSGAAATNEGASYVLNIVGNDVAGASDPLSYSINWGDGSALQNLTAAQLAALSGNVSHVFADDEDGPVNTTPRSISVTVNDGDGGSTTQGKSVDVNNVAPTIALGGLGTAKVGLAYTLTLGSITDPGQDTVSNWLVNWGDGSPVQNYAAAGNVTHVYASAGSPVISVGLVDEDGTWNNAGTQTISVTSVPTQSVTIGNAPARLTLATLNAWVESWTRPSITLTHKANANDNGEAWSPVTLNNIGYTTLAGGDISAGNLGVSGQSVATSATPQDIEGSEGLRLQMVVPALSATLDLAGLLRNDDGLGYDEAGRVQAFDADGNVVAETVFHASGNGSQSVTIAFAGGFSSLVITSGAYNGSAFVGGAYSNTDGSFGSAPFNSGGKLHGSDFSLHAAIVDMVIPSVQLAGLPNDDDAPMTAMLAMPYWSQL